MRLKVPDRGENYAIIELEALAIVWAIKKAKFYLRGMPHFDVITDHRSRMGVFSKSLTQLDNHHLTRIREKVMDFNFDIVWRPGKENVIADALSCSSTGGAGRGEKAIPVFASILAPWASIGLLTKCARRCTSYRTIREAITAKQNLATMPRDHPALLLCSVWNNVSVAEDELIIVDGNRIFVPIDARREITQELHRSHCGLEKTLATARGLYYWPGMRGQLKQMIEKRELCQKFRPSWPPDPLIQTEAGYPMARVSADLFEANCADYIVMVDRYSGYPFVEKLRNTATSSVLWVLEGWFRTFGYPQYIRTDGGPQFRTEFMHFCQEKGVVHKQSSPY